jgi:hypothetical protein
MLEISSGMFREIDNSCDLFLAKRLWIEKSENTQCEFGSFTLGVSSESYTEIVFDKFESKSS